MAWLLSFYETMIHDTHDFIFLNSFAEPAPSIKKTGLK